MRDKDAIYGLIGIRTLKECAFRRYGGLFKHVVAIYQNRKLKLLKPQEPPKVPKFQTYHAMEMVSSVKKIVFDFQLIGSSLFFILC